MIVVKVELWSAITGQKTELARMSLANVGVTPNGRRGDYHVETYHGRDAKALAEAMRERRVTRSAEVKNHPRLSEHVWNLVAKGLNAMGYGK